MTAIKDRGETPFEEAGEGVLLRFSNADLRRTQAELGSQFITEMPQRMNDWDFAWMDVLLKHGAKKDGQPFPMSMDQPGGPLDNVPVAVTAGKLIDAVFISYHGISFSDHVQKISEMLEEEVRNGDGPLNRSSTSTLFGNFDFGLSDAASSPTSSGTSAPSRSARRAAKAKEKKSGKRGSPAS